MSRLQVRCTSHHNPYLFVVPPEAEHPAGEQCRDVAVTQSSHPGWLATSVRRGSRAVYT